MKLTPSAFTALAELLRLRNGPASLAASMVFTEGVRPADAARAVGCMPQTLTHTLRAVRRGTALAEQVVAGLEKDPQ